MLHKLKFETIEKLFQEEEHPDASVTYTQAYYDFQFYVHEIMCLISEKKEVRDGYKYDVKGLRKNIVGLLEPICVMLHLLSLECPELDDVEEFIESNVAPEIAEDPLLTLANLQISFLDNFTVYFLEKGGSMIDDDEFQSRILENTDYILAGCCLLLNHISVHPLEIFESENHVLVDSDEE